MRNFIAAGAIALVSGLALTVPAHADLYKNYGYDEPTYRYDSDRGYYRRAALMDRRELIRQVERQGYYDISDLHPNSFGNDWQAVAYINGDLVNITIDGYTGRVLYATEI
jgi:hypothetical protein